MGRVGPDRWAAATSPTSRWPRVRGSTRDRAAPFRQGAGRWPVGAGALEVDLRFVLLNGRHNLSLPHVVHGLWHFGRDGWKFAGKTLVERLFGLKGGAIEVVGAAPVAEAHGK